MMQELHDQNFKNLFLDFPKETLAWILPQILESWGTIKQIEFLRQEPKKRKLADRHLILDMPILFSFERGKVLLWLVEFQEDKSKFSIYKLLRYTTDLMEAHPDALVIPTVLFSDRTVWKKDVLRQLEAKFQERIFLHFEYVFIKLFDFHARDYYHNSNPVVKILLPKMNYDPHERWEVIRQAYIGLFQFATPMLFEKYADFIDVYAEVREEEREQLHQEIFEDQEKPMISIKQLLKEEGLQQGLQQGVHQGNTMLLSRQLARKYQLSSQMLSAELERLSSEELLELGEFMLDCDTFDEVQRWINDRQLRRIGTLN